VAATAFAKRSPPSTSGPYKRNEGKAAALNYALDRMNEEILVGSTPTL